MDIVFRQLSPEDGVDVYEMLQRMPGEELPPARLSDDDSARRRYSFHALPIA